MITFKELKFKEFITLQRGFDLPKKKRVPGEYPVIGSTSVDGYHNEFKVKKLGVVTGRSGSLGEVLCVDKDFWPLNTTLWVRDFKGNNPKFVYYFLKTMDLARYNSGVGVPTLNRNHLDNILVRIPEREYQDEIVSVLSCFDDLVEVNSRRIGILEELAQGLYKEWFANLRFPGHEKEKIIKTSRELMPDGWKIKKLGAFGKVATGKTPSKADPKNFGNYMPFIKIPDMHDSMFCTKTNEMLSRTGVESQKEKTLPPNSICVSCIGTAGLVSITHVPSQTNQQINSIILDDVKEREFLYFALRALKQTIELHGAAGATMTNLSRGKFMNLEIIFPEKKLVLEYNKIAAPLFDEIGLLQEKKEVLVQTRDLLLPKLISGEIDLIRLGILSD